MPALGSYTVGDMRDTRFSDGRTDGWSYGQTDIGNRLLFERVRGWDKNQSHSPFIHGYKVFHYTSCSEVSFSMVTFQNLSIVFADRIYDLTLEMAEKILLAAALQIVM